jgi:hypothetical protein
MNITDGWGSRVAAYLVYRRSFGFELAIDGRQLESFAHFADQCAAKHRTPDVAADWARNSTRASQIASARRIETLRGSAKFQVRMDHDTVIPKPNATRACAPQHRTKPQCKAGRDTRVCAKRGVPAPSGLAYRSAYSGHSDEAIR